MELSETLANNTMNVEYMPMPSYTESIILLIEQKRKEKVRNKQISEEIKANLTDFRWLAMFVMALKKRRQNKKTQEATAK